MLYSRDRRVEFAPLKDETILLQPDAKTFCLLNRTAAFIWNEISAPASAQIIAQRLADVFEGVSPEQALKDVSSALTELVSLGFVTATVADAQTATPRTINQVV